MITDTVQCKSCYNCATPGHTFCKCGLVDLGASDEVQKQVLKNVINGINVFTTSTLFLYRESPEGKTIGCSEGSQLYHKVRERYKMCFEKQHKHILERYQKDE